jgi:hypothetical protein
VILFLAPLYISVKKEILKNFNEINLCFVVFGDGSADFKAAAKRLALQANDLEIFKHVYALDSELLSQLSIRYKNDIPKIISLAPHPLYYRAVKPWAILCFMEDESKKFDVIFYIDAGCELPNNIVSKARLKRLVKKVYEYGAIAERTGYKESSYSKENLIAAFRSQPSIDVIGQVQSTWSMFKNTTENRKFMAEWIEFSDPKYNYWQDPTDVELKEQIAGFIAHRHDQSIFSLLYKKYHLPTKDTFWEYGGKFGNLRGLSIPIHATRNKAGKSMLPAYHTNNYLAILSLLLNYFFNCIRPIKIIIHKYIFRIS